MSLVSLPFACLIRGAPAGEPWRVEGISFSSVADMRLGDLDGGLGAAGLGQGSPCTTPYALGNELKGGPAL